MQIRVHAQHLGYPILGDETYGGTPGAALARLLPRASPSNQGVLRQLVTGLQRPCLHALTLGYVWIGFTLSALDSEKFPKFDVYWFFNVLFLGFQQKFYNFRAKSWWFMDWSQVYTSLDTGGTQFHLCSTSGLWRYMAHLKTTWLSKLHSTKEPYAADGHNLHHSWKPFVHHHCRNLHTRVEINSTWLSPQNW